MRLRLQFLIFFKESEALRFLNLFLIFLKETNLIELYCPGFYIAIVFSDNHFAKDFVSNFCLPCNHFSGVFLVFR